ncbi:ATPase [Aureococcus anophagefferens]|uniref:ATPase n=2 Tax=Aureococcus anophagefferens TaxID=44056 RepID=A0ABR1G3E6_AURAN
MASQLDLHRGLASQLDMHRGLEVDRLTFSYTVDMEREVILDVPVAALRQVGFRLPAACRCVVAGGNGAGKSTLLRLLAGRHTPESGSATFGGDAAGSTALNGRVAYVAAEGAWGVENANLEVGTLLDGAAARAGGGPRLDALAAALRVDDRLRSRGTRELSDGERRKVQLFVALAPEGLELVLLDEACVDLDALVRDDLMAYLEAQRYAVLYATHVFDGLDDWPTHVLDVRKGAVAATLPWAAPGEGGRLFELCRGWLLEDAGDGVPPPRDAPPLGEPALRLRDVTWRYDPRAAPALRDAALTLPSGCRAVVAGANGAGKSTLLSLVAGARLFCSRPESAVLEVLGRDPSTANLRDAAASPRVAYLGGAFKRNLESGAVPPRACEGTFASLLASSLRDLAKRGGDAAALAGRAGALAAALGVDGAWRPSKASSGQRTRMQLVLQLTQAADLYVVDELTRDLDVVARQRVLDWLADEPGSVIYATHVFQGLGEWGTHVVRVASGEVKGSATTDALLRGASAHGRARLALYDVVKAARRRRKAVAKPGRAVDYELMETLTDVRMMISDLEGLSDPNPFNPFILAIKSAFDVKRKGLYAASPTAEEDYAASR